MPATAPPAPSPLQALSGGNAASGNVEAAKLVGAKIAELCKQKNIEKVGGGVPVGAGAGAGAGLGGWVPVCSFVPGSHGNCFLAGGAKQCGGAQPNAAAAHPTCAAPTRPQVCFDRGGFRYHGRVQALADAAREAGLSF